MTNRQRTILAMLKYGERYDLQGMWRTYLMKCAFMAKESRPDAPGKYWYSFVPYRFGPFSFALYRDTGNLIRQELVLERAEDRRFTIHPEAQGRVKDQISRLPFAVRTVIHDIVSQLLVLRSDALLEEVYRSHPWYAILSERKDLAPRELPERPLAEPAVYTLGYEGRTVDDFFAILLRTGIRHIVDVRYNPISRQYGFAKSSMSTIASKLGIQYRHHREAGIPPQKRNGLSSPAEYDQLFAWYNGSIGQKQDLITHLSDTVTSEPSVMVCMERNPDSCHRSRLANHVASACNLPVVHLGR